MLLREGRKTFGHAGSGKNRRLRALPALPPPPPPHGQRTLTDRPASHRHLSGHCPDRNVAGEKNRVTAVREAEKEERPEPGGGVPGPAAGRCVRKAPSGAASGSGGARAGCGRAPGGPAGLGKAAWRPFLHRGLQREARADRPATRPASRPVSAGPCRLGRPFQPSVWACVSTESTEPRPASRRCSAISSPASAPTNRTTFALPGEEPGGPLCFLRGLLSLGRTRRGLSLCLGRGSDELAVPDPCTAPSPEM